MLRRFFTDKNNRIVVAQSPNLPLIAWFVFLALAHLARPHGLRLWAGYVSDASLVVWAALEIGWGANYFRRTLGAVVLVGLVLSKA